MEGQQHQGPNRSTSAPVTDGPGSPRAPTARWIRYGQGLAMVFEFTGTVCAGAFVGYFLDQKLGTEPWLLIGLTLAAVALGFVRLVKVVRRFEAMHG